MARTAAAQWGLDGPPRHFIGGTWHTPHGAATIAVENPATGACIGEIADGCAQDVDSAVTAATLAMRQQWTPAQRQDALLDLARTIEANAEAFAQIETLMPASRSPTAGAWTCPARPVCCAISRAGRQS